MCILVMGESRIREKAGRERLEDRKRRREERRTGVSIQARNCVSKA